MSNCFLLLAGPLPWLVSSRGRWRKALRDCRGSPGPMSVRIGRPDGSNGHMDCLLGPQGMMPSVYLATAGALLWRSRCIALHRIDHTQRQPEPSVYVLHYLQSTHTTPAQRHDASSVDRCGDVSGDSDYGPYGQGSRRPCGRQRPSACVPSGLCRRAVSETDGIGDALPLDSALPSCILMSGLPSPASPAGPANPANPVD